MPKGYKKQVDEPEVEQEEAVEVVKPKRAALKKAVAKQPEPVELSNSESESAGEEEEAPKARGRPKAPKEPRAPSLWLTCLREHGYMMKGAGFKPTPKKGTPEYEAVRKTFDARKAEAKA